MTREITSDGTTRAAGAADALQRASRPDVSARSCARWIGGASLIVLVGSFLCLKTYALAPHPNDDGLYFYAALRWAQGAVPYRDFFHAHPPLHLAPTALLFGLTGYSFALGKAVVFAAAALQGILGYVLVSRLLRAAVSPIVRETAALVTTFALLFCPLFLVASSDDTGLVQSSALLALSGTALAFGRPWLAGCLVGAAMMTSMQAAPLVACLIVGARLLARRGSEVRMALAATGVVLLINLLGLAIAGRRFFDQVYLFHLAKPANAGEGWQTAVQVLRQNWTLAVMAAVGTAMLIRVGGNARRLALLLAGAILLHFVAMATRPRVFYWYFLPVVYPAAVLAGLAVAVIGCALLARWRRQPLTSPRISAAGGLAVAALAAALIGLHRPPLIGLRSPHAVLPYEMRRTYEWNAQGPHTVDRVVRRLLWNDGHRTGASRANSISEYLWRQSVWLDTLPAMAQTIREFAANQPGTLLFGDYSVVPLVSLETNVKVVEDFIDTTAQRMAAGFIQFSEIEDALARRPDTLVLVRSSGGLAGDSRFNKLIGAHYQLLASFRSHSGIRHSLYGRRQSQNSKGAAS